MIQKLDVEEQARAEVGLKLGCKQNHQTLKAEALEVAKVARVESLFSFHTLYFGQEPELVLGLQVLGLLVLGLLVAGLLLPDHW